MRLYALHRYIKYKRFTIIFNLIWFQSQLKTDVHDDDDDPSLSVRPSVHLHVYLVYNNNSLSVDNKYLIC